MPTFGVLSGPFLGVDVGHTLGRPRARSNIDGGPTRGRLGVDVGPLWEQLGCRFWCRSWVDVGSLLGSVGGQVCVDLGPTWSRLGADLRPNRGRVKVHSRSMWGHFEGHLASILGSIWDRCWMVWGSTRDGSAATSGSCWGRSGADLGSSVLLALIPPQRLKRLLGLPAEYRCHGPRAPQGDASAPHEAHHAAARRRHEVDDGLARGVGHRAPGAGAPHRREVGAQGRDLGHTRWGPALQRERKDILICEAGSLSHPASPTSRSAGCTPTPWPPNPSPARPVPATLQVPKNSPESISRDRLCETTWR